MYSESIAGDAIFDVVDDSVGFVLSGFGYVDRSFFPFDLADLRCVYNFCFWFCDPVVFVKEERLAFILSSITRDNIIKIPCEQKIKNTIKKHPHHHIRCTWRIICHLQRIFPNIFCKKIIPGIPRTKHPSKLST